MAISGCGRFVAVREPGGLRILGDGAAPIDVAADIVDVVWVAGRLWLATPDGLRVLDAGGTEKGAAVLSMPAPLLRAGDGVVAGDSLARLESGQIQLESLGARGGRIVGYLGGLRTLRAHGRQLRVTDPDKVVHHFQLGGAGEILRAIEILDGAALAIESATEGGKSIDILKLPGSLIRHIEIPDAEALAIASGSGRALAITGANELIPVDLRYGRVGDPVAAPIAGCLLDLDDSGDHVAIAARQEVGERLAVYQVAYRDLFASLELEPPRPESPPEPVLPLECVPEVSDNRDEPAPPIPAGVLAALVFPRPPAPVGPIPDVEPYSDPHEHLDDVVELASARVATAIAARAGELELTREHFERRARGAEDLESTIIDRVAATVAAGARLPLVEVSAELGLEDLELEIIAIAAAPAVSAEAVRLYAVLADDSERSVCDRALIAEILGRRVRRALGRGAPLFRLGLLEETPSASELFAHVFVSEALLDRLRGSIENRPGALTTLVEATTGLDDLPLRRALVVELVESLQRVPDDPVRLVVRGRPGLGGIALLSALAARVGAPLAVIDAERLPEKEALGAALRRELIRARLWGAIPCVANLDARDREADAAWNAHLREVFRTFEGPVLFRCGVELDPPIDPGYLEVTLPDLSESARLACWSRALERRGLDPLGAGELARRTRLGPSAIDAVVARASADGTTSDLAALARQHIAAGLKKIATRIERLGTWDQLALDPDTAAAVSELIARSRGRRTVFDRWGFDGAVSSSRGLTALFSGPPGTGKTLVAGVIARELGLDLYRVDLARLVSKWIGETEKNLARLFDAAEDSQAVLLFDEADALFSRRTEVKSSNDRHANMETGYLLQRLDSFEGIAILTTNLGKSIDRAVARRLSMRIDFPFPDDRTRVALWKAHLPGDLPIVGGLELERLAREYPMTGGYVKNCALRAAFLAAADGGALTLEHLERAICLEYTQAGRISASGRLE